MANTTKFLEKELLKYGLGLTTTWTKPTYTYAALFTTAPNADYLSSSTTGLEVSATNYTRQQITWGTPVVNNDLTNSSKVTNSADLVWTADANWGTVKAIGVFNTQTKSTGDLLWFGNLSADTNLTVSGNKLTVLVGGLTVTLA